MLSSPGPVAPRSDKQIGERQPVSQPEAEPGRKQDPHHEIVAPSLDSDAACRLNGQMYPSLAPRLCMNPCAAHHPEFPMHLAATSSLTPVEPRLSTGGRVSQATESIVCQCNRCRQ